MKSASLFALRSGIAVLGLLLFSNHVFAQVSAGGSPLSFRQSLAGNVPTVLMPKVDVEAYLAEDALADKDEAYRFGASIDVHYTLENSGKWTVLPDGSRIWRLRISSPEAFSISLLYDNWFIPEECDLFIYNDEHDRVIGSFTSFNNWVDGTNITAPVAGDAVTLEYHEAASAFGLSRLSISNVVHAYRNFFGKPSALDNYGDSGTCNNNVNCPEGALWQTNKRGVAMILTAGGSRICTGSLINNTAQNSTPYFLTANHCLGGNNTWQFMFNYEAPTCTNANGPTNQTVSNSTLRANHANSDFALLQISSSVPVAYNPYFNGWNRVDAAATNSVCIHHPSGDIKKITFDNNAPVSSTWSGTPANSHWRILAWDDGTTEPGSSGSPLFDQNHRITGQLHGGTASCSNNIDDYFGKFSMSWTGGGTNATRLSNWLDPGGSAPNTLDGLEGSATMSITVTAPNGGETWIEGTAQNITWTSVGISGNVNIDLNRSYSGGTWESIAANTANDGTHSWTVTLPASAALARIRITSVSNPTISDVSNANFTIAARVITVTSPNGSENWIEGTAQTISWTSSNVTGNVNVELNRTYPGGAWESLFANTTNDGNQAWTVTLPATSTARIRVTSVSFPTVMDESNGNFSIAARTITVLTPNGGETWNQGVSQTITWTSSNITGNVNIELNRSYSGGTWEAIATNTTNDGGESWLVTIPASTLCRVRVTSVSFPAVSDVSDANFTISAANTPPVIAHDPLDDQVPSPFTVTAIVTDNAGGFVTRMVYWPTSGGAADSVTLAATGNPNEFAATVPVLVEQSYAYILRSTDAGALQSLTDTLYFEVRAACGTELVYDDGVAEASHYSDNVGYQWAVKFTPPVSPYALCYANIGVSSVNPDANHTALHINVYAADGLGGLPGTLLHTKSVGSIGNQIGGVPADPASFAHVVFDDGAGNPLVVAGEFYVAVSNPVNGKYEAFLHDTSGAVFGRSFVYDPCDSTWIDEAAVHESARRGNRMIRAAGYGFDPPTIVVSRSGNDIRLDWDATGAPYYHVYSDLNATGTFVNYEGTSTTTTFIDLGAVSAGAIRFYLVKASTTP